MPAHDMPQTLYATEIYTLAEGEGVWERRPYEGWVKYRRVDETREARFDETGELDEFVTADALSVHLEQMNTGHWNLVIAHADGTETLIDLTTKRPNSTPIAAMIVMDPIKDETDHETITRDEIVRKSHE